VADPGIASPAVSTAVPRLARDRVATRFGAAILVMLLAAGLFAPLLAPYDPNAQSLAANLEPPSARHLLGRDKLGRDQLSRIIYGARVSLKVGLLTVAISLTIGVGVGALAGFSGGAIDFLLMRAVDILLAFPGILLAIAMSAVLGPGIDNVVIALSVIGWTGYARLVRGEVLSIMRTEHIEAARALGALRSRILFRHVLPLLAAPLVVQATFGVAGAIVAEASLSFLGLGVQPPTPSWGAMVNEGRSYLLIAPYLVLYPGLAIFMTVLGLNALGDALRDRLDVRSR
jgi:peptide/nickel transport system permease protein